MKNMKKKYYKKIICISKTEFKYFCILYGTKRSEAELKIQESNGHCLYYKECNNISINYTRM